MLAKLPVITFITILGLLNKIEEGEYSMTNPDSKNTGTQDESVRELFHQNEIQANKLVSLTMLLLSAGLLISWALNMLGVFWLDRLFFTVFVTIAVIFFGVAVLISRKYHGDHPKIKYFLMSTLIVVCAMLDALLSYNIALFIVFPLLLSLRYYSEKYTIRIAIASAVAFTLSAAVGSWFQPGMLDLNFVDVAKDTLVPYGEDLYQSIEAAGGFVRSKYFYFYMSQSLAPKLLQYAVFGVIAWLIAKCGRKMVIRQAEISAESSRIGAELDLATRIQTSMLPCLFPAFPEHENIDLHAVYHPAKEVGGDFYDYFVIDKTHVGVVIADVSGKGVGAALFMTISKTVLKNQLQLGISPEEALTNANRQLCENNDAGLFVTCWAGVFDTETGVLSFVNAGHNPPVLLRKGERPELIKQRGGLVLAGIKTYRYKKQEISLAPGDELLFYTDGVTEAQNAERELYGEGRLIECLSGCADRGIPEQIEILKHDIDKFVNGADQFDYITIMAMRIT